MKMGIILVFFCFLYGKVTGHFQYSHSQDIAVPVTMFRPISYDYINELMLHENDMYYYNDYVTNNQEDEQSKKRGNRLNTNKDTPTKSSIIPGAVILANVVNNKDTRNIDDEGLLQSISAPRSTTKSTVTTPPNQPLTGKMLRSFPKEARDYMRNIFRLVLRRIS